ncbi:MAG: hypothetical protein IH987_09495 [Planctomycetes bacterium]|nr:hypothetical protein [Planctomycetota bacterium]
MNDNSMPSIAGEDGSGHDLTYVEASKLLKLGMTVPEHPVDRLVKRLRESDGSEWLTVALRELPEAISGAAENWLLDPSSSLAQIKRFKQRCIDLASKTDSEESWLIAMVGYFFAIAAALAHHGEIISTRKRDEVDGALRELENVVPDPWRAMLTTAAEKLKGLPSTEE